MKFFTNLKLSSELTSLDFTQHPVWEFTNNTHNHNHKPSDEELSVAPVLILPVKSLEGRIIGTDLILANQQHIFGELIGLKLNNVRLTKLVLSFIVHLDNKKFLFRRSAPNASGPEQLASFLGLSLSDIFPIRYDIEKYAIGAPQVIRGEIQQHPSEILARHELYRLILDEQKLNSTIKP